MLGNLTEANDKVVPGWSLTSFSTGLPQCINLGTAKGFILAIVTATTGEFGLSNWSLSFGILKPLNCPHSQTNDKSTCQQLDKVLPKMYCSKEISRALSFYHCIKTDTCPIKTREVEKMGDPKVMAVMYSEWISPLVSLAIELENILLTASKNGSSIK